MSITAVKEYLKQFNLDSRVQEFEQSSATVELAAQAADVIPARIAKTLSFKVGEGAVLIVTCGDTKIDNQKTCGRRRLPFCSYKRQCKDISG